VKVDCGATFCCAVSDSEAKVDWSDSEVNADSAYEGSAYAYFVYAGSVYANFAYAQYAHAHSASAIPVTKSNSCPTSSTSEVDLALVSAFAGTDS
jgi:hypothetical protein